MTVEKDKERESVSQGEMSVALTSTSDLYSHEFGHCIGLPDEYSTAEKDRIVRYFKPDGTLDRPIKAPLYGKDETEKDASMMSTRNYAKFAQRHAWNIAIETQSLLSQKIGREIKCKVII